MRDDPAARLVRCPRSEVSFRYVRVPAAYARLAVGCQAACRPRVLGRELGHIDREVGSVSKRGEPRLERLPPISRFVQALPVSLSRIC